MPTLLKIDVSPRGPYSVSRKLGDQFIEQFKAAHTDINVTTRDLATTEIPFVNVPWMTAAYTPEDGRTPEHKQALKLSDEFIAEIKAADHILLTTPMYNFAVPAVLKAWIDHIVRAGVTFRANPDGSYTGLVPGKKVTVIIASSGVYTPGAPAESFGAEKPYLKQIFGFMGITDLTFVEAGGTHVLNTGKTTLDEFVPQFASTVKSAATA